MPSIDFVEDKNPDIFLYLDDNNAIPEYVKAGSMLTKEACADLSDKAFADPTHRLYPCHTKEACWMSAAHFAGRHVGDASIKANIEKQASFHGIAEDVQKVFEIFAPKIEKKAASEEPITKFALSIDWKGFGGRGVENYYPISNPLDIMSSSENAARDFTAGRLPLPYLQKAARAIVEAAEELSGTTDTLAPVIIKYGSVRLPDPRTAAVILTGTRKNAGCEVSGYSDILSNLCDAMAKSASVAEAIDLASDAAREMFNLDQQFGIKYGSVYQDPFQILFCGPTPDELEKHAASTVRILGVPVPVADFINLSDKRIDAAFRKEAAATIRQAKETVSGSPSMEKTAAAANLVENLSEDVQKLLLRTLADTCF